MKPLIFLLCILICSCTDTNERPLKNFKTQIKNGSTASLTVKGYNSINQETINELLEPNEIGVDCEGLLEVFIGMTCEADSIVFRFSNDKGYICSLRQSNHDFCFGYKHPFVGNETFYTFLGDNTYEFTITQQDFENAFELP